MAKSARRSSKVQRSASSGAPGIRNGMGGPALNPIGINTPGRMPHGNFLDPNVALKEIDHPSAKWAGIELQPIKPRK